MEADVGSRASMQRCERGARKLGRLEENSSRYDTFNRMIVEDERDGRRMSWRSPAPTGQVDVYPLQARPYNLCMSVDHKHSLVPTPPDQCMAAAACHRPSRIDIGLNGVVSIIIVGRKFLVYIRAYAKRPAADTPIRLLFCAGHLSSRGYDGRDIEISRKHVERWRKAVWAVADGEGDMCLRVQQLLSSSVRSSAPGGGNNKDDVNDELRPGRLFRRSGTHPTSCTSAAFLGALQNGGN